MQICRSSTAFEYVRPTVFRLMHLWNTLSLRAASFQVQCHFPASTPALQGLWKMTSTFPGGGQPSLQCCCCCRSLAHVASLFTCSLTSWQISLQQQTWRHNYVFISPMGQHCTVAVVRGEYVPMHTIHWPRWVLGVSEIWWVFWGEGLG